MFAIAEYALRSSNRERKGYLFCQVEAGEQKTGLTDPEIQFRLEKISYTTGRSMELKMNECTSELWYLARYYD